MVKMFKEKVFENKRLMRWASLAFAVVLAVTVAPYIQHAWGEGGGDPASSETIPEAVPISQADLSDEPQSLNEMVEDEVQASEEVADDGTAAVAGEEAGIMVRAANDPTWVTTEGASLSFANDTTATVTGNGKITVSLESGKTYTLTINGTVKETSSIIVPKNTTLNLNGTGTLDGDGKGSVIIVEGNNAKLVLNKDQETNATKGAGLKIIGGTGTAFQDLDGEMFGNDANKTATVGGGIQVKRGDSKSDVAELVMYNGTIGKDGKGTGNSAQAGGGIFIDRNCKFTMHNGAVVGNTATKHEGGGIFLAGGTIYSEGTSFTKDEQGNWKEGPKPYKFNSSRMAEIKKGKIADNRTQTTVDWGGGGLFIESKGDLKVGNIIVTKNHADGLGGGISGCPHAKMGIGEITGGAAIYGNTASKSTRPNDSWLYDMTQGGKYTSASSKTGDIIAYTKDSEGFTADKAKDFYCTKASVVYGSTCTWEGRIAYFDRQAEFKNQFGADVSVDVGDKLSVSNATLGLTATPVGSPNESEVAVQITNNSSTTHGGGIGCNGTVSIGTLNNETKTNDWSLTLGKEFKDVNGDKVNLTPGTYTFGLYKSANENDKYTDSNGNHITATNDADGKVVFSNMIAKTGKAEGTWTFYAKEIVPADADSFVDYDTAWRKITVTVTKTTGTVTVFPTTTTTHTYLIPDGGMTAQIQNANGQFVNTDNGKTGATFTNKVKPDYINSVAGNEALTFHKTYTGPDNNNDLLSDDTVFTFEMYRAVEVDGELQPELLSNENAAPIAVAKSNAKSDPKGEVKFKFENSQAANTDLTQKPGAQDTVLVDMYQGISNLSKADKNTILNYEREITVFVKEKAEIESAEADDSQTTYDEAWRKVTLTFKPTLVTESEWNNNKLQPVYTTSYKASIDSAKTVYAKEQKNEKGETVKENGKTVYKDGEGETFANTVWAQDEYVFKGSGAVMFTKSLLDGHGRDIMGDENINNISKTFTFEMYAPSGKDLLGNPIEPNKDDEPIAVASNNKNGEVTFEFTHTNARTDEVIAGDAEDAVALNMFLEGTATKERTVTVYVKEKADEEAHPQVAFDEAWHKVELTFTASSEVTYKGDKLTPTRVTTYTASLSGENVDENVQSGGAFENVYHPSGKFDVSATKFYYGSDLANATGKFSFSMVGIPAPEDGKVYVDNALDDVVVYTATNGAFDEDTNQADIEFRDITFTEPGVYWFMIGEDESDGSITDPRVYVIEVHVSVSSDGMSLDPGIAEIYYAEGATEEDNWPFGKSEYLELTKLDYVNGMLQNMQFGNFDSNMMTMGLYGYAINAASNEPIEEQCFVDPKIIKNLEGRSLTEGEFNFKLIQLEGDANNQPDWSVTQGPTISETSNDRYGMVDFDKANNVSGDWENPSCLLYTAPGTYYYRVVEANESTDPSVEYSDQIITFTTVIERVNGQLVCTDMYYGHVEDGVNVRYEESSNPEWHPDMYNYAKGADLQVRKTSALDRNQGLEGATYGLYAVNNGAQADIFIQEATSDADGWITFEDVNLTTGTLYYFKEREAPAGHTVSEFRSDYFYLTKDNTAPNGYVMNYTEDKIDLGVQAEESAIMVMSDDEGISTQADNAPIGPMSESGNMLFTFARDGGVFDEATTVDFNKLDTRTHEWVEGAALQVIEKSSGTVIDSWVSGKAPEKLQGKLNVNTEYILREVEAPEGYAKADDVVFKIGEYGAVEIVSGTSNGNASIAGETITLYDTMLDGENLITENREVPEDGEGTFLAKTGDILKIAGIVILAIVAICGIVYAVRRRKSQA